MKDKMVEEKYPHRDLAIPDVVNALRRFPDLTPVMDRFVCSCVQLGIGKPQEVICCKGTIPVRYRDKIYNIPIKLFLSGLHPCKPPLVYVTPTSNMVIKAGKHVDNFGRVFMPYLTDWQSPSSDLYELIQILCLVFGDEPPVFSVKQTPSSPPLACFEEITIASSESPAVISNSSS